MPQPRTVGKRSVEQVADRMVALLALHAKAMKTSVKSLEKSWGAKNLRGAMSAKDKAFYRAAKPTMDKRALHSWGMEKLPPCSL